MRLGDLDALKENIKNAFKHNLNGNDALLVNEIYEFIDNAPTVDMSTELSVAYLKGRRQGQSDGRPKGKWITRTEDNGVNYRFYCSCCNREVLLITEFCPYCGAEMKGDTE